jgi:hypothetical protein
VQRSWVLPEKDRSETEKASVRIVPHAEGAGKNENHTGEMNEEVKGKQGHVIRIVLYFRE